MGFFSSFFGGDQRNDIKSANSTANSALDKGFGQSQGYYDQAAGGYQPYTQQGGQANAMYGNLLGLNGTDARSTAQNALTSDPIFQGQLGQQSNALLQNMNARGDGAGGNAAIAGQKVFQQNYGNWLDRYKDAGQQGLQATNALAGVRTGQGDNAYGYGATKAGNAINYGNALAGSRGIGANNVLGLLGAGAKAYGAYSTTPRTGGGY